MHSIEKFLVLTILVSGAACQSTRSSMHMDSDGGTPFFNFAIPVKNESSSDSMREADLEIGQSEPIIQQASLENSESESGWGGWLGKLRQPVSSIPLPRTDLGDDGTVLESDGAVLDGLETF